MANGVELIEKNKSMRGEDINLDGKLRLNAYRKLIDPRSQLVASSLNTRTKERETQNHSTNEDPYRSFRRGLIVEARQQSARGGGTANSRNRAQTSMSKQSRNSKQNERFTSSIDVGSEIGVGNQTNSGKFESRYDRKGGKSMINLNTNNKVSMGDNTREYANFLAEINPAAGYAIGRDSMNSSHMMIEISDVDIKDPSRLPTGKGNSDYHLNLKAPPAVVHKGRYGNSEISRPGMGSIVASARNELDNYSSAVPRARHSMLNTSSGQYGTIA